MPSVAVLSFTSAFLFNKVSRKCSPFVPLNRASVMCLCEGGEEEGERAEIASSKSMFHLGVNLFLTKEEMETTASVFIVSPSFDESLSLYSWFIVRPSSTAITHCLCLRELLAFIRDVLFNLIQQVPVK